MPERLLSAYQVADLTGATPGAVVEWVRKGLLPIQNTPDGQVWISQEALVQFLKSCGQQAEPILARLGASQPALGEPQAADADLPRLDLTDYALAASPLPTSRSVSLERMFPLDPVATQLREARPQEAAGSLPRGGQPAAEEAGEWPPIPNNNDEKDPRESAPQESSEHPSSEPAAGVPLITPQESEALLGEAQTGSPVEQDLSPQVQDAPAATTAATPSEGQSPRALKPPPAPKEDEGGSEIGAAAPQPAEAAEAAMAMVRDALARRASDIHIASTAAGLSRPPADRRPAARGRPMRAVGLGPDCDCGHAATAGPGRHPATPTPAARPSGQADLQVDGREVAVTVATCPTTLGQRMVVSLRDRGSSPPSLAVLGLTAAEQQPSGAGAGRSQRAGAAGRPARCRADGGAGGDGLRLRAGRPQPGDGDLPAGRDRWRG